MYLTLFILFINQFAGFFTDEQPSFKGGQRNLASFIDNALIYPEYSKENCLQGTVQISFKLNKSGQIYESKVQKGFGTDLDSEALRVVRLTSGKWIMPSSHDTLTSLVLPVNFALRDSKCFQRSKEEINAAINAYQARLRMNDAIFNFYDKKSAGNVASSDEAHINDLKLQLGYDEKFIDRLLKQAERKIKQGDRQGACEDLVTIKRIGSNRSAALIDVNCR